MNKNRFAFLSIALALSFSSLMACGPKDKPSESSKADVPSSSIDQSEESSQAQPSSANISSDSTQNPSSSKEEQSSSEEISSSAEESSSSEEVSSSSEHVEKFTVTWKNYDGQILEIDYNVPYGANPSYDYETPVKPSDDNYNYVFIGWTPAVTVVTSDQTYTATYNPVSKN